MIKFLLIIFCIVGLRAEFIGEIELEKDEVKTFDIFAENTTKLLSFRWTLYKDNALVIHLKYDNIPHQFVLYKSRLNSAKIHLSSINSGKNENPHMIFYFTNFDDATRKARFRYYLFRFNNNIEVM